MCSFLDTLCAKPFELIACLDRRQPAGEVHAFLIFLVSPIHLGLRAACWLGDANAEILKCRILTEEFGDRKILRTESIEAGIFRSFYLCVS